jgi:hypothetical protein
MKERGLEPRRNQLRQFRRERSTLTSETLQRLRTDQHLGHIRVAGRREQRADR